MPLHATKIMHFIWIGLGLGLFLQISGSLEGRVISSDLEISARDNKIKGIHYFGRRVNPLDGLAALKGRNIKEVVLVPYANQKRHDDPMLRTSDRRRSNRSSRTPVTWHLLNRLNHLILLVLSSPISGCRPIRVHGARIFIFRMMQIGKCGAKHMQPTFCTMPI